MKVQAVQTTDQSPAAVGVTSQDSSDFSSYLKTSSSLEQIFEEAAATYGVPKDLLKAIAKAESDFNPNATSGAGAQGIMQLMPATARSLGVTDSYDPYQNIMGGAKYISQMLDSFGGNITMALAAYNAGPNNVIKYGGVPPFKETQNYVVKVTEFMNGGISVPNVSYNVPGTHEDSYYQSVLDELFSYEDYLAFLDIYTKIQEEERTKKEEDQVEEQKSDSYFAYQDIRYSPAVLNLIGSGDSI